MQPCNVWSFFEDHILFPSQLLNSFFFEKYGHRFPLEMRTGILYLYSRGTNPLTYLRLEERFYSVWQLVGWSRLKENANFLLKEINLEICYWVGCQPPCLHAHALLIRICTAIFIRHWRTFQAVSKLHKINVKVLMLRFLPHSNLAICFKIFWIGSSLRKECIIASCPGRREWWLGQTGWRMLTRACMMWPVSDSSQVQGTSTRVVEP